MTKLGLDEENDMQRRLNVCVRVETIICMYVSCIGTSRKLLRMDRTVAKYLSICRELFRFRGICNLNPGIISKVRSESKVAYAAATCRREKYLESIAT